MTQLLGFKSQASKTDASLFCSDSQPSECNYVLFVCLSVRLQISFIPCVSDTLAGDFLSAQLTYRGTIELCHSLILFAETNHIFFADVANREN